MGRRHSDIKFILARCSWRCSTIRAVVLHIPKGRKTKVPLRDMAIIETAFDRVANHHGGSIGYISA